MEPARVVGVLLAAGAGRRAGGPKVLRISADGTSWLLRSVQALRTGGCADILVVLGCEAGRAAALLGGASDRSGVRWVVAADWSAGLSASLRVGLNAAQEDGPVSVLVHLVDLPDVGPDVVRRVLDDGAASPGALVRAGYAGRPGHPVLIGCDHLAAVLTGLDGDQGAGGYLTEHRARIVECGDLASGHDQDARPPDA